MYPIAKSVFPTVRTLTPGDMLIIGDSVGGVMSVHESPKSAEWKSSHTCCFLFTASCCIVALD